MIVEKSYLMVTAIKSCYRCTFNLADGDQNSSGIIRIKKEVTTYAAPLYSLGLYFVAS